MQLYYHRDPHGNFGDDLNEYLWRAVAPELLDRDDRTILVGIGTLLDHRLDQLTGAKVVFGSGSGYGPPPRLDDRCTLYCVRGPLTCRVLGVDETLAITDPAVLLTTLELGPTTASHDVSFMPHHRSARLVPWRQACDLAGLHYIDPRRPVLEVLDDLRGTRLLVTEAMHGAVVADAFRVPWIPVRLRPEFLSFKWDDWAASLGLDVDPVAPHRAISPGSQGKVELAARAWGIARFLARTAAEIDPQLSSDSMIEDCVDRLSSRLDDLCRDHRR